MYSELFPRALLTIQAVYEYTYDDWGRTISKARGMTDSAIYTYH